MESPDTDVAGSLDKILVLPPEEVKTSLILPLSETQAVVRKSKMKPVRHVECVRAATLFKHVFPTTSTKEIKRGPYIDHFKTNPLNMNIAHVQVKLSAVLSMVNMET